MNKPKRELNPKLEVGDKVRCLHMDGETSVTPMTQGVVRKITRDPFESDGEIIIVDWDNGSTLSLLSTTDTWIKIKEQPLQEQTGDAIYNLYLKNPEVFENFDYRFLNEYLRKLRKASPVNMLQSQPFLYSGREWIDRYYGEDQENNKDFQEVLEMADEAKDKMIQGILKYMESKGIEIELSKVNHLINKFSSKILQLYISFF
jgi:hypothetical protein